MTPNVPEALNEALTEELAQAFAQVSNIPLDEARSHIHMVAPIQATDKRICDYHAEVSEAFYEAVYAHEEAFPEERRFYEIEGQQWQIYDIDFEPV